MLGIELAKNKIKDDERYVRINFEQAKQWYNNGDAALKDIVLQAYTEDELSYNFKKITTFEKACEVLNYNYHDMCYIIEDISVVSKSAAAMFQLNIIRRVLNLGYDLHLADNSDIPYIYYPYNLLMTKDHTCYKADINSSKMKILGTIICDNTQYDVLGGTAVCSDSIGIGCFNINDGIGDVVADVTMFGCASKEIAEHFSKYFGMLIIEAKCGDIGDFKMCYNT